MILSVMSEKQSPNTAAIDDPGIAAALVPSTSVLNVAEPLAIGAASFILFIVVESSIVVLLYFLLSPLFVTSQLSPSFLLTPPVSIRRTVRLPGIPL